jgi:hypothetical protein
MWRYTVSMSDTNQHTHTPDFTLSTGMMGKLATTVTNHYIQPIIQFRPLSNGNRGTLPSILAQQFVVGWTVSAHVSVDILRSVLAEGKRTFVLTTCYFKKTKQKQTSE